MKKIEFFKKDRKKFADIHGMEYRYSGKEGVGYFVSVKKVQINKLINDRAKAKSLSGSKIAGLIK